jgi:hypothetical protein
VVVGFRNRLKHQKRGITMLPIDDFLLGSQAKYNDLLDKVRWFFEVEDALRVVRSRVFQGKATIGMYSALAVWAGDIESALREECE